MIIIDMSEHKYKRTLREYSPPFNPADWDAMQQRLKAVALPTPWWKKPQTWAVAASLLLLLSTIGIYCNWQEGPLKLVGASSLPKTETNFIDNQLANEKHSTTNHHLSTNMNSEKVSQKPQNSFFQEKPQNTNSLPAATNTAENTNQTTNASLVPPTLGGVQGEEEKPIAPAQQTALLALGVDRLPVGNQAQDDAVLEEVSALPKGKGKALVKTESFWQVGIGFLPQPQKNTKYEQTSRLMGYLGYSKAIGKRVSVGLATGYHQYTSKSTTVYSYTDNGGVAFDQSISNNQDYHVINIALRADYYPVIKRKWAWYAGTHIGYQAYLADGLFSPSADYALELDVTNGGSYDLTDRSTSGATEPRGKLWFGLHTGIKYRIYRRLGAFAEVGYQPSNARFGLTWSY